MFKSNGGFTLVELIVVIAILAILAGVALPAYSGYIEKANEAADLQILSAVYTAAAASLAEEGEAVSEITVTNGAVATINGEAANADFATYFDGNDIPDGLSASWSGGKWTVN